MKNYCLSILIIGFGVLTALLIVGTAFAQEEATTKAVKNIVYPVVELGNCGSEAACRAYCDKKANGDRCFSFAEKNGLMSADEIQRAKKFISAGSGPGGCTTKEACETYCNDITNIDVCVTFAEKNGLMSSSELNEAKKVKEAIKRGIKPPACGNKKACDAYCESPDHMEECITFGEEAGFINGQELTDAKKMLSAIKKGVKPPPCKGKEECDAYCGEPDNMEVCMTFAEAAGFMDAKQAEESKKVLSALKQGIRPPKCKGKEECDAYCGEESHFEECTKFAEAAGFMSKEEAEMARKTGGKGAGGCKSKEECEAFCNNPDNQETCFNFAKENGLIKPEDLQRMEEGKQRLQESLNQAPPTVQACLGEVLGIDMVQKMKEGTVLPPKDAGEKMKGCFEKSGNMPDSGMIPQGEFKAGPGGCKTPEECRAYCESKPEECGAVGMPQEGITQPNQGFYIQSDGQNMPVISGPGGCKTPDECRVYCENHAEECKGLINQPGTGGINNQEGFQVAPFQIQNTQLPPDGQKVICKTPEECKASCMSAPNPEECVKGFDSGSNGQPGNMPMQFRESDPTMKKPMEGQQFFDPNSQNNPVPYSGDQYKKPYLEGGSTQQMYPSGGGESGMGVPSMDSINSFDKTQDKSPQTNSPQIPNNSLLPGVSGGQYPANMEGQYPYPAGAGGQVPQVNGGGEQYQYPPNAPVPQPKMEGDSYMPPAGENSVPQPTSMTPARRFVGSMIDAFKLFVGLR